MKFGTVGNFEAITVSRGVDSSHLSRDGRDPVDENKGAEQKEGNNDVGKSLALYVVPVGEMAVLPDDIGRLGAFVELELVADQSLMGALNKVSKHGGVVSLKSDESSGGGGQGIEVLEEIVDLNLLLTHGIEVLGGNGGTTSAKSLNETRVGEREDDVGDLSAAILALLVLLGGAVKRFKGPAVILVSNPGVEFGLDLLAHLLLKSICGSLTAGLHGTTGSLVDVVSPFKVAVGLHGELDGVVTSSDGGAIPLDHLDLAALVHEANRDGEKESNEGCDSDGHGHRVVPLILLISGLDAGELHEKRSVVSGARRVGDAPEFLASPVENLGLVADGLIETILYPIRVGFAVSVQFAGLADEPRRSCRVNTVVVDLANRAEWAGKSERANGRGDLSALHAGVTKVAHVSVEVRALHSNVLISRTTLEEHDGGQEEDGVEGERPDEAPQHVEVSDDTKAESGNGVSVLSLLTDWVLSLLLSLLNDLLAVNRDCL